MYNNVHKFAFELLVMAEDLNLDDFMISLRQRNMIILTTLSKASTSDSLSLVGKFTHQVHQ